MAQRTAARILVVVSLALPLSGCAAAGVYLGLHALGNAVDLALAGDSQEGPRPPGPDAPRPLVETAHFSLEARLHPDNRVGNQPYIVCLIPLGWGARDRRPVSAYLEPARILLKQSGGSGVRPAGYARSRSCPDSRAPDPKFATPAFSKVDFQVPLLMTSSKDGDGSYPVMWLLFDVRASVPNDEISLELGSLTLDGIRHAVPPATFDHPRYRRDPA